MEAEHKAMTCHLHSEADAAWKKMHEVMYNHQLEYDQWLSDFLKEAEAMLANMRDQIWTAVHTLAESHTICRYHSLSFIARSLRFTEDGTQNKAECPPSVRRSEHRGP